MKIKSITIDKFRKLENVNVDNVGLVNELNGSNGTGKTSFISFITWIIYGETLDYGSNDEMNLDTFKPEDYISGIIEFDNGFSLARTYGNDNGKIINDYFYNGRKCKSKAEYNECVLETFSVRNQNIDNAKIKSFNLLRALSDPYYLNNNPNGFRELISKLINLDTYSILFADQNYLPIKEDFDKQRKDFDLCLSYYKDKINGVDSDIKELKNSISNYKGNITGADIDFQALSARKKDNNNKLDNIVVDYNNLIIEKQNALLSKQKELETSIKNDNKDSNALKDKKNCLRQEYNSLVAKLNEVTLENYNIKNNILVILHNIGDIENKYNELKAKKFAEVYCPNCNALINEGDYKKFNTEKVKKLNAYTEKINQLNKDKETLIVQETETLENQIKDKLKEIDSVNNQINNVSSYESEETKKIKEEIEKLSQEKQELEANKTTTIETKSQELIADNRNIDSQIEIYNHNIAYNKAIEECKVALNNALQTKADFESKLILLKKYKNDEIMLLKKNTTKIFGNDFDFEMLVKNKTNDNYKKVCYASIDGLEHTKENTAQYLYYSILMLEKIKKYINPDCDIPTIFDIADNLGETALNKIIDSVENSQIFYTKIEFKDNIERNLKVVK